MLGIPESRAKGYISVLVAQGKIPRMDELPAPRYFPEAVDHRVRLLINRVMDWVWAHPKTEFEIISSIAGKYFKLAFYEDDVHMTYVKVGEDFVFGDHDLPSASISFSATISFCRFSMLQYLNRDHSSSSPTFT